MRNFEALKTLQVLERQFDRIALQHEEQLISEEEYAEKRKIYEPAIAQAYKDYLNEEVK